MPAGITKDDNMVSTKGIVPWHGLGRVLQARNLTGRDALRESQTDYEVEKVPITVGGRPVDDWIAISRKDNGGVLGIHGKDYLPFQNTENVDWADWLVGDEGGCHWETMGSLHGGKVWFGLIELPFKSTLPDSPYATYLLVVNSHNGTYSLTGKLTRVRAVCENTVGAGLREKGGVIRIRHTKNGEQRKAEGQKVLGLAQGAADALEHRAIAMLKAKLSVTDVRKALNALVPVPEDEGKGRTQALNIQAAIRNVYQGDGYGQPDIFGTAWGLYNAVVVYNDHLMTSRTTRASSAEETRFSRVMLRDGNNLPAQAAKLLIPTR